MKRLVPLVGAAALFSVASLILSLGASAFAAAQDRNARYRYFSDALTPVAEIENGVDWSAPQRQMARDFTEADEHLVGVALGSAWRAHALAQETGEFDLLQDYFSGVALTRAKLSAGSAHNEETRFTILDHEARPDFYHLDGSVVQIVAETRAVRFAIEEDQLILFGLTDDVTVTTLMNETTGWRVFSHEMTGSRSSVMPEVPLRPLERLAGINYYPAATPWRRFWPEFDFEIVSTDLAMVRDLGANAVRIFLPSNDFGSGADPRNLRNLETFLTLADGIGLRVVPTLFDMRSGYSLSTWADDAAYLKRVLPLLAEHSAVAFIDIKNEPDLDFETHGAAVVEAWLRTMIILGKALAPDMPFTVGWAHDAPAARFADLVDVVSYHDYAPLQAAAQRLEAVERAAGGKPVYVTEIGASTYSAGFGFPGTAESQDRELTERLSALSEADGVFVWTLHDFEHTDAAAVGDSPWTRRVQARFGLIDGSGLQKPAAESVSAAFSALLGDNR